MPQPSIAAAVQGTEGPAPIVLEVQVNAGTPQRSMVTQISARFSAPVNLSAADRLLLKTNKSKLVSQVVNGEVRALYVVRVLRIGGTVAVLFCEIDQSWLWQGISPARVDSAVAVLDHEGRVLQSTAIVPAGLLPMLQAEKLPAQ